MAKGMFTKSVWTNTETPEQEYRRIMMNCPICVYAIKNGKEEFVDGLTRSDNELIIHLCRAYIEKTTGLKYWSINIQLGMFNELSWHEIRFEIRYK